MRTLLIVSMMLSGAIPSRLLAQGGNGAGDQHAPVQTPYYATRGYGWGYPGFYENLGSPSAFGMAYTPSPIYVMPAAAPAEPPPPPVQPPSSVMHAYSWPDSKGEPGAAFSIVSRNGSVHRGVAVWVEGSAVRYTAANGTGGRVELAAVDCSATLRLNAEHKLTLSLPGCSQSK